jgi:hypothetical protein
MMMQRRNRTAIGDQQQLSVNYGLKAFKKFALKLGFAYMP